MSDWHEQELPELQAVKQWPAGFSWIAYPDEQARRASHGIHTETGVWLVDPVDAKGLDDQVTEWGDVSGVVVLHDRHTRDAVKITRRHDIAVSVPKWMKKTIEKIDAPTEPIEETLPETDYGVRQLINTADWEEAFLVHERTKTVIVPESVGTLPSFRVGDNELGVHPSLEEPPRKLIEWNPDRILVGHGQSIHRNGTKRLQEAFDVF